MSRWSGDDRHVLEDSRVKAALFSSIKFQKQKTCANMVKALALTQRFVLGKTCKRNASSIHSKRMFNQTRLASPLNSVNHGE
jgi:hypothetical protein